MNIFSKLKFWGNGVSLKGIRAPFITPMFQRINGVLGFMSGRSGLNEFKNWVYACVTVRSEDVGNIDLFAKNVSTGEVDENNELLNILYKPNPYMTKNELFEATQAFKDLDGNAYWYLARDKDGEGDIKEIYPMRPDKMAIVVDKENALEITGYVYTASNGQKIPFTIKEILHFKNFNPTGGHPMPHKGMSIVEGASWAIDTDNEIRKWNFNFFKNNAKPDGILYSEGGAIDQSQYNRLKEQWKQEHQGSENTGKVAILSGGLKWQEISRNQKDMDFSGQRNFNMEEILALFRVPKFILGMTTDISRANADASIYVYMLRTIKPQMQRLVDTINEFLVPEFNDGSIVDFKSPVPEDRAQIVNEYTVGMNKWLSRNEIRAREGLPPTDNGDVFFGSFGDMEQDKVPPQKEKAVHLFRYGKKKSVEKSESAVEKSISEFIAKLPKPEEKKAVKEIAVDVRSAYITHWEKGIDVSMKPLMKKLVKYFDAQKSEVMENLKSELKGLEAKEYMFKGIDDMLFDEDEAIQSGISLITPFIRSYIQESGKNASKLTGTTFDNESPAITKWIDSRAKYFAKSINDTTRDSLFATIKEGMDNSEDLASISERVAEVYGKATDYRTDMIARTEVSASANFGAKEAYSQAGVEKWEWVVVNPKDEDCQMNAGEVRNIGDAFPSGAINPPDDHPNCVCTTLPIFED